jgi:Rrf2 family protein
MQGFFRIPSRLHLGFILMTELAKHDDYLSLRDIGERMKVSDGYLEEIAAALKTAKLIKGRTGPKGGYRLAKDASAITALDIVRALEGPVELVACHGSGECPVAHLCSSKRLWDFLQEDVRASLKQRTLSELM